MFIIFAWICISKLEIFAYDFFIDWGWKYKIIFSFTHMSTQKFWQLKTW